MKTIELSQEKFALIDDEDYDYLMRWKWHALKSKNTFYAVRNIPAQNGQPRTGIGMHRAIMNLNDKDIHVDHEDHNGLNNQKYNIRVCTRSQNMSNRRAQKNSSSKYVGVCFRKDNQKWQATVHKNGKQYFIGFFNLEEDAAKAYDRKAKKLKGQFANLNFKQTPV